MRRLWRESIRHHLGWLIPAVICMALVAAATAFSVWLLKPVIDEVFVAKTGTCCGRWGEPFLLPF